MSKIERSLEAIREAVKGKNAAVMLSFGKDSMVLAHLIRRAIGANPMFPSAHFFALPVIWHRTPWFPHKNTFGEEIAKSWGMELHDWTPMHAGIKVKKELLELVARYNFGNGVMDLPLNVCEPEEYPRHSYICGLNDWLNQPKSPGTLHKWEVVLHGHKSSDVDPFEGNVPLNADAAMIGGIRLVFPLREWTDTDVWDYIETNHVPFQKSRYSKRSEFKNKWFNPDYTHACTACIDPRNKIENVFCPKLKSEVPNVSERVLQLNEKPDYIGVT